LGGEIYRNDFKLIRPFVKMETWLKATIFPPHINRIFKNRKKYKIFYSNYLDKINTEINEDFTGFVKKQKVRKYYGNIKLPHCDGLNCNANNVHSFYFTPFIENDIISESYNSIHHHGIFGSFEADLIAMYDPKLLNYNSHYGHTLNREPIIFKFVKFVRGITPSSILEWKRNNTYSKSKEKEYVESVVANSKLLIDSLKFFENSFPELNFYPIKNHLEFASNMIYIAFMFNHIDKNITKIITK